MNEYIKTELSNLINLIKINQPINNPKSTKDYYVDLMRKYENIDENIWRESIRVFLDKEMYKDKPVIYFEAIIANKIKDMKNRTIREIKELGDVPGDVI